MTLDDPLVSIITPVYNGAKFLDELIQSVQQQDYPNIEHIVIDDGSTDNGATLAVLRKYPRLRWWSRGNLGQYATMNEGLEAAKGDLVCFVSADDLVAPGAIQCVVQQAKLHREWDGITGRTQFINGPGEPYPSAPFQTMPVRYYAYLSHISHCSLYLKRERLLQYGLYFDPSLRYVGDYDWMIRIVSRLHIRQLDFPLSKVRVHETQTSKKQRKAMGLEQSRVVEAHQVNRVFFKIGSGLYIIIHDMKKFFYEWRRNGLKEATQMIFHFIWRGKE
jgi:glycosyltransferase involved in cell wall biosynthesis